MNDMPIKQCHKCYHIMPSGCRLCRYCAWPFYERKSKTAITLCLMLVLTTPLAHTKSFWDMTPVERREAAAQRERDKYTPEERARWQCSDQIARKVPGAEWVRRTAWPTIQTSPGVWSVAATFTAYSIRGVPHHQSTLCRIQLFTN